MFSIYNIVKNRRVYFILSLILIVPGLIAMIINTATLPTHTPWRLSVDFREGTRFVLKFQQPTDEGKIRAVFTQDGVNNPEISQLGAPADNLWQVRTSFLDGVESQKIQSDLEASVGA